MNIREEIEEREKLILCEYATLSCNATRQKNEKECDMRVAFQRDRDRILHSNSFRRLKHKTQVFLSPEGDHYRTRLTHTLEVSQIGRTIARALRLNEDFVEAASMGHDLGHTPFGHAGERALDEVCPHHFRHSEQSVREAQVLEKSGEGLNLTEQVLDAILNHSGDGQAYTPEGQIVRFADKIAYVNHDVQDALRAGIITTEDIPKDITDVLGDTSSKRINAMVTAVVKVSRGSPVIDMEETVKEATFALRQFLFDKVYTDSAAKVDEHKAIYIVEALYLHFVKNPDKLPDDYKIVAERDGVTRAVADYIAGMTDNYAVSMYSQQFLPKFWKY